MTSLASETLSVPLQRRSEIDRRPGLEFRQQREIHGLRWRRVDLWRGTADVAARGRRQRANQRGKLHCLAAQAHREPDMDRGGDNRRAERHHPDRHDEALRLVGCGHALPVWRQRRAFGVGIAQETCRCHANRIERPVAGPAGHAILAAKAERHAMVLQFQHFAIAVGMTLQFVETCEELRAGIDVAAQHDHERLSRPGAGAAPGRVQGKIVEQAPPPARPPGRPAPARSRPPWSRRGPAPVLRAAWCAALPGSPAAVRFQVRVRTRARPRRR